MDTSINAINSVNTEKPANTDKNAEKMKELVKNNKFESFDVDKDGKISGTELAHLKAIFTSITFDQDDEDAIDQKAFNDALSDYQE